MPGRQPRVAFVDLAQWDCFVQFAAALRRRGVRVERVTVAPHSVWERVRRCTQRLIFSRIDSKLRFDGCSRAVDLDGVASLLSGRAAIEATDVVAEALSRLPRQQRRASHQPSDSVLYDKLAMTRFADSLGVAVPETWAELPADLDGWLVVKRRLGSGGTDVRVVRDPAELSRAWAESGGDGNSLVQRFVHGEVVSVGGVALDGELLQAGGYRSQSTECARLGPSAEIIVIADGALIGAAGVVVAALGYTGAFCINFVRAPGSPACLIDFNSRIFGSWLALQRAGLDIVGAYLYAHGWSGDPAEGFASPGTELRVNPYRTGDARGAPSVREVASVSRVLGARWLLATSLEQMSISVFEAVASYRRRP